MMKTTIGLAALVAFADAAWLSQSGSSDDGEYLKPEPAGLAQVGAGIIRSTSWDTLLHVTFENQSNETA